MRSEWARIAVIWTVAGLICLPVILHWSAPAPSARSTHLVLDASYVAAAALCYWMFRIEAKELGWKRAFALVFVVFLLTCITNQIHSVNVDHAANYSPPVTNEQLQEHLQDAVVRLSPEVLPHSYRFLPNAAVYWLQMAGTRYDAARDIYRLLVGLLLFYGLYRFARLYTDVRTAVLALLFVTAIFPVSYENYVGQLTDPLSQLSFVLAFIFLETENFALLLTTLLIGSLAKESVLALSGFYALTYRGRPKGGAKAVVLCVASLAIFVAVRVYVLHSPGGYQRISGVTFSHFIENWRDFKWQKLFLLTGGSYLPFLVLNWRRTPERLRILAIYLIPVLFASSLFFSWLSESRNWMPLVFILSVVAAQYWGESKGTASYN